MQLGGIAGADEADLPPTVRRSLPSFHGGLLDVSLELGTIVRPSFLVTAKDSPLAFAEGDRPAGPSHAVGQGRMHRLGGRLDAASVLQASGFCRDVTVFRLMQRVRRFRLGACV
jgi:hypothetical protein